MSDDSYNTIVTTMDHPVLVLAGPGAGKTYLLGDRTKRLLEGGVDKNSITLLTYNKDASQNMRNKLLDPISGFAIPYENLPHVSTLHSISFEVVNRKPRIVGLVKADLRVQSNENVKRLLFRDAALLLGRTEKDGNDALRYKQEGQFLQQTKSSLYTICEKYWEIMSKCNCIDFDDQINFACRILEEDEKILEEYQQKCQHLLVDEYQDINAAQFKLIQILSNKSKNGLFAVGDDAQSIYGFRGGDPTFILRFSEDFTGASTPPLACSRRCHQRIMEDAALMLKSYYPRWTGPFDLEYKIPIGEVPYIWQLPSDNAEAEWIARIARKAVAEKKNVLILAPKKEFFPRISLTLSRYGVPHGCPVNLLSESINDRLSIIADILEWLKNPNDSFLTRLAIECVMNHGIAKVPGADKSRRCSPQTIQKRIEIESEVAKLWNNASRKRSLFKSFLSEANISNELEIIRNTMSKLIDSYSNTQTDFLGDFAKHFSLTIGSWSDGKRFTSDLSAVIQQLQASESLGFGSVQLMTMRKAKGLEADIVVIAGLEDDLMPNPISDLAEEARLFYVSMTRAKEKLYLLHSYKRLRNISFGEEITNKKRSRFLDSLGRKSIYRQDKAKTS